MITSFYNDDELSSMGFMSIGKGCKISRKASFYNTADIVIGENVRIDDFCILSGNITLGNNIHISAYVSLYGRNGIVMEDYTGISPRSTIYSAMDDFSGDYLIGPIHPAKYTNVTGGKVIIKRFVQIAANCIVFPNLTIGEGCVIGACSMVRNTLDPWGIYYGVPVQRHKERSKKMLKYVNRGGGKELLVLGIGHNTPVFIDLAESCGYEIKGLYHYAEGRTGEFDHGYEILGSFNDLFVGENLKGKSFLLTMGNNELRIMLTNKILSYGGWVPSLIHPNAIISKFADISPIGVYISPFTYVQADTTIERNTVLLSHVNISHTNILGRGCFIAGGATIGAYTEVGDFVFVGQGALSISGKVGKIGTYAYIGARSLLTHDVPAYAIMVGAPAKNIK